MSTKFCSENLNESGHLEDLGIGKRIIVQDVVRKTDPLIIFDITWSTWKMTYPEILLSLHVHSLSWEHIYRVLV
jgi:hypothetical protein